MALRNIIEIDEQKCNGCGECVPACEEGALRIIDGKARLVSDVYCDGLGACLGKCPQGAIKIIEREADAFDEEATRRHLAAVAAASATAGTPATACAGTCPGSAPQTFQLDVLPAGSAGRATPAAGREAPCDGDGAASRSALNHWPVQLRLVQPTAEYFHQAHLLLAADCVPFAYADFHRRLLRGRALVIGCPKLDQQQPQLEKLARMIAQAGLRSITVARMEVPCCSGLTQLARAAAELSGREIPIEEALISVRGELLSAPAPVAGLK